ncbi:MAG: tripartite tricarboxylate transporter substrate binding protein [Betaproteobacteria bacterium]
MKTIRSLLCTMLACGVGAAAWAQDFPSRPITLICPWPAGGSTDQHLRMVAQLASKHLGQPIVVENRAGAGGTLGAVQLATNAKPDGYTIAQIPLGVLRFPHMQKTQFDPRKDFTYIIGLSGYTFGLVVRPDTPWMSLTEFIAAGKQKPGAITYGSTGNGTSPHLVMEDLQLKTGATFQHVPFKGNAEGMNAFLGGHIDAMSDASGWGPHVDAGKARLVATFTEQRTKRWPTVPTAKEQGVDLVYPSPYGLGGPKGMDPKVVQILHDAFKKALDDPEHMKTLEKLDQVLWYKNSADYTQWSMATYESERATLERLGLSRKD